MAQISKGTVNVVELAPCERVQQRVVGMPMPQILKETVQVIESVSPASAVTDTVPGPVTKDVAPTRAATFDERAPMIKYVAPSPAVLNRKEEIIEKARCLDEFKRQLAKCELQHPMIGSVEMPLKSGTVYEMANRLPGAVFKYWASLPPRLPQLLIGHGSFTNWNDFKKSGITHSATTGERPGSTSPPKERTGPLTVQEDCTSGTLEGVFW